MNKFILISIIFSAISIANCNNNNYILRPVYSSNVITDNGDSIRIKIYKDNYNNLLVNLEDTHGFLLGSVGLGNSDLVQSDTLIKKYKLNGDKINDYVINTYVRGSTYGAENLIIIWWSGEIWKITAIGDYGRQIIADRNNDGIYEIVMYLSDKKERIVNFKNGCLKAWK